MSRLGRNAVVALLGSIVLAGLLIPGSASAATHPAVQLKVCNKTNEAQRVSAAGRDQNGKWTDIRVRAEVGPGDCYTVRQYHQGRPSTTMWFATDQWVQVYIKNDHVNKDAVATVHLPKSLPNGSTKVTNIVRSPR